MQKIKFLNTGNRTNIVKAVLVLGVIFLFGFTRIWKLATLPLGIHIDEAGMAYDAWCLSQYGVDRYLKPWPVYLTNFGSGQSSLYAFLCAFLFKLFGYSIWMMRVPAVLFSFLNLVFGIKIVKKIYPHKVFLPIAAGGLLTVCPYFIMAGRLGLDCNLMLGMSTVFLYFIITAIESRENGRYILAGVTGGILLYTYALTYVIVPVFLFLLFLYVIRIKKFYFRGWAAMAIPFGVIAVPLILVQIVNLFDLEEFRLAGLTITKLQTYRVSELGHFQLHNLRRVLESILWGDSLNYNSIPQFANLFWITNVFFLVGLAVAIGQLWNSVRKRRLEMSAIVLVWFISIVVLGSHVEVNVNKMNGVFYAVVFWAVIGMDACIRAGGKIIARIRVSEERKRRLTNTAVCMFTGGLLLVYTACFTDFSAYYFSGNYSKETYLLSYFHIPVTEALEFIEEDNLLYSKETQMAEPKIVYAISALTDPAELKVWEKEEGIESFKNYRFNVLGEISDQNNYIVRDGFEEYCTQLRAAGFREVRYDKYSLFYKK